MANENQMAGETPAPPTEEAREARRQAICTALRYMGWEQTAAEVLSLREQFEASEAEVRRLRARVKELEERNG